MYDRFKFTRLSNPDGSFIFAGKWYRDGVLWGFKGDGPTMEAAALDFIKKFEEYVNAPAPEVSPEWRRKYEEV